MAMNFIQTSELTECDLSEKPICEFMRLLKIDTDIGQEYKMKHIISMYEEAEERVEHNEVSNINKRY